MRIKLLIKAVSESKFAFRNLSHIKKVLSNFQVRLNINHAGLERPVTIHLQPKHQVNADKVMERFNQVLNSNKSLAADESFTVSVGILQRPKGGGKNAKDVTNLIPGHKENSILLKRSVVYIPDNIQGEFLCASRAITVCIARHDFEKGKVTKSQWTNLIDKSKINLPGKNSQRSQALALQTAVGLSASYPVAVDCLYKFEDHLNIQIIVIASEANNNVIYRGKKSRHKKIFLYKTGNHYHSIVNIDGFFQNHSICIFCITKHLKKTKHVCDSFCSVCDSECILDPATCKICPDCGHLCRNERCFQTHKTKQVNMFNICHKDFAKKESQISRCKMYYKCVRCFKHLRETDRSRESHVCGEWVCKLCTEFVTEQSHYCYIRAASPKSSPGRQLFFDFETRAEDMYECASGYIAKQNPHCKQCKQLNINFESNVLTCSTCRRCVNCNNWRCGLKEHTPNFLVAQTACDNCKNEPVRSNSVCEGCGVRCSACSDRLKFPPCANGKCGLREMVYSGDNVVDDFCSQLFTKSFKDFNVIAHFGKGFDHLFILRYCVENAMFPKVIFSGTKIMNMRIDKGLNINFLDSMNFLPMPLRDLPRCLGLGIDLRKGDFPHLFNSKENERYVGPYPDLAFYGIDFMSKSRCDDLVKWYTEFTPNKIFSMQDQILEYCRNDVEILRLACVKFRDILLSITSRRELDGNIIPGIDPFDSVTIASCCSRIYRQLYLKETHDIVLTNGLAGVAVYKGGSWYLKDTGEPISADDIAEKHFVKSSIPHIPTQGYRTVYNHSKKSIGWLEWMSQKTRQYIQHARTPEGEFTIPGTKISVDGYAKPTEEVPLGTVYQFAGCRWHGCEKCFPEGREKVVDFRREQTMNDLLYLKNKTDGMIRMKGFSLVTIWECEWDTLVSQNPEIEQFINAVDVEPPITIRDALFGGRTNATRLFCEVTEDEKIHYDDFTSLYPYCNAYKTFPVSHPKIITSNFDETLMSYFGLVKAKVLPPRRLYIPILPFRSNEKLTFPLCRTCVQKEVNRWCKCSDENRSWVGTFTTEELKLAMEYGYKLVKIYEIYHYEETLCYDPISGEQGLFTEYMRGFLKIKQESSGYPDWVSSEVEKNQFIRSYFEHEGIMLDKDRIEKNPGMRSIAKLCLNSLWGKFCERPNRAKTEYVTDPVHFLKLKCDPTVNIKDFHIINEDVVIIERERGATFEEESYLVNEVIGVFTTSHARIKLARLLQWLGPDRVLYHDTDSVIYLTRKGDELPRRGDYMGDLANELSDGVYITKFYSSGPKCYGYLDSDGNTCLKLKGIRLTVKNREILNLESVKEVVFEGSQIQLPSQNEFVRDKYAGRIFVRPQSKLYKAVYTKRLVTEDYNTLPYGY